MLKNTPRRLALMSLLSVGLFLSMLGLGMVKVSTEMDKRVVSDSINLVSRHINGQGTALEATAIDYNNWDTGYLNIQDNNLDAFYENYASAVESGAVFKFLHILDGFDHRSVYWDEDTTDTPIFDNISATLLANAENVIRNGNDIAPNTAVHFFTFQNGHLEIHAMSHVLPLTKALLDGLVIRDEPLAIMTRQIDAAFIDRMAHDLLLQDVTITQRPIPGRSNFPIESVTGESVAYVNWISPKPGLKLVQALLPLVTTLSIVFVAISAIIAVIAHRNAVTLLSREQSANRAARTDTLTAIANRMAFAEKMDQQASAGANSVALIYLDLNNFKRINDTFGHEVGDAVVIGVAQRLSALSNDRTLVARMGGDEFSILLVDCMDAAQEAAEAVTRIGRLLGKSLIVNQNNFDLSAAIGVAVNDRDEFQGSEILRRADVAMYHAKRSGSHTAQFYDDGIEQVAKEDFIVERALRHALESPEEIDVLFQPIVSAKTGKLVKAEALARWNSKTLGRVSPEKFISIAERSGLINALGNLLFEKTCAYLKDYPTLNVGINVSPIQLQDEHYLFEVNRVIEKYGISPERIDFELTEGIIVENKQLATYRLKCMKDMGFKTSLDDFGTGFSSIGYLRNMPFDTLKIDRSFLLEGATDPKSYELINGMIIMGQSLGQVIVCEGIETTAQANLLRSFGCELLQGYLFDKAIPIDLLVKKYLPNCILQVA